MTSLKGRPKVRGRSQGDQLSAARRCWRAQFLRCRSVGNVTTNLSCFSETDHLIIDFGKNTYEHRIEFGFDCVPAQFVREVVSSLLVEKNAFASVSKDVSTGDSLTVLTKGTGSEDAPFHQLKFARDKVILWCGWHTPYEHWQKWRSELLPDILAGLAKMPNEFVSAFVSQGISSVPFQRLKRAEVVPELEPIRQLYRRFLPPDLL